MGSMSPARTGLRCLCVKGPVVEAPGQVSSCLPCSPKTGCAPRPAACPDLHAGPMSGDWPGCTLPVGSGIPELGPQSAVWGLFPPLRPTTSLRPDGADAAPPLPPPSTPPPPGGHWSVSPGGQEQRDPGALASSGRWDSRSPCGTGRLGLGLWSGQRGPFSGSLSELRLGLAGTPGTTRVQVPLPDGPQGVERSVSTQTGPEGAGVAPKPLPQENRLHGLRADPAGPPPATNASSWTGLNGGVRTESAEGPGAGLPNGGPWWCSAEPGEDPSSRVTPGSSLYGPLPASVASGLGVYETVRDTTGVGIARCGCRAVARLRAPAPLAAGAWTPSSPGQLGPTCTLGFSKEPREVAVDSPGCGLGDRAAPLPCL